MYLYFSFSFRFFSSHLICLYTLSDVVSFFYQFVVFNFRRRVCLSSPSYITFSSAALAARIFYHSIYWYYYYYLLFLYCFRHLLFFTQIWCFVFSFLLAFFWVPFGFQPSTDIFDTFQYQKSNDGPRIIVYSNTNGACMDTHLRTIINTYLLAVHGVHQVMERRTDT